jgi:hypothetical protein
LPEARQRLVTIDGLRHELAERLEAARAGMFAVLKIISKEAQAAQARAQMATIVVFVLSSILGLGVAAIGALRLIRSIKSLVQGAEAVESGNLDTRIEIGRRAVVEEIATLQPGEPPAIALLGLPVGGRGVASTFSTLVQNVARRQCRQPGCPIGCRPLGDRQAAPLRVTVQGPGHRALPVCRSFRIVSS